MDINVFTDDFVNEWNGNNLNVNGAPINFDGRYGTQCMDLWNYWWTELGLTGIQPHADAAGVWEDKYGKHYEYFDGILPVDPAKKGDVFIYNRRAWGTGYGHIGIVLEDLGDSIRVLETNGLGDGYEDEYMNQYGSPARIHDWPKTNLYGYLRYIGEEMASTEEIVGALLTHPIPRQGAASGETNLGAIIAGYDSWNTAIINEVVANREIIRQLAVKQGVVIDYDLIAEKVADEQAKRMKN